MNPKDAMNYVVSFNGVDRELTDKQLDMLVKQLAQFEPTPEQERATRLLRATAALEMLAPEDLTHAQRVGLFNRLVELLAAG